MGRYVFSVCLVGLLMLITACAAADDRANRKGPVSDPPSSDSSGDRDDSSPTEPDEGHEGTQQKTVRVVLRTGNELLGAYSLVLKFDPEKADLKDVTAPPGNTFQSPFFRRIEPDDASVSALRIASFEIDRSPSGTVPVAIVTFVSTDAPSTFIRGIQLETASDPEGESIAPSVTWEPYTGND